MHAQHNGFDMPSDVTPDDYIEGRIIYKLEPEADLYLKNEGVMPEILQEAIDQIKGSTPSRRFPLHQPPGQKDHKTGEELVDLSRIYYVDIPGEKNLEWAINRLYGTGMIEYAQPQYIPRLLQHQPDDPLLEDQYYLKKIQAFDAWEVSLGDTNTVIGIIDTGTDLGHPDLYNSIKYNYDDPVNGEDSDNDGFVDNFYGWDLGEDNKLPQYNENAHGVHVSGIAAATADNGTGIAGTGYNSKFLPVKIDDEHGKLVMAYEGIVYAADRGADIINCSWGGHIGAGPYGRDIVNYAIFNRDVLVIAAAGNSDSQAPLYPAAYEYVFSVAATDEDDVKTDFSSYGITVDVSAPGINILSTWKNSQYISSGGTSMSAPIVSGAAAIMRSHFPEYNALQIAEQLKVTTDNIDTIAGNVDYTGLLGTGRINLHKALTQTGHPSLRLMEHAHTSHEYSMYRATDTMNIAGTFVNFLAPTDGIEVSISSSSPYVEIIDDTFNTGEMGTMEPFNNDGKPFMVILKEDIPVNHKIEFKLSYKDNIDYQGVQYFSVTVNIDHLLIDINRITTTLTSTGTLGYNYPDYQQGVGFLFDNGRTLIKCAGLIAGKSTSNVVDNIYGPAEDSFNELFVPVKTIRKLEKPGFSDFEVAGTFKDDTTYQYGLNIEVDQYAYVWEETPKDKFIIIEYDIINNSDEDINNFYAGFFADWVINDIKQHRAAVDTPRRMGFAYSVKGELFKGISLLSDGPFRHYAFDNEGFDGSLNINDGFTSFEKYTALKGDRSSAGIYDADNDVSTLVGSGPYNFSPEDTVKVAFAIIAGDHLDDIKNSADIAHDLYQKIYEEDDDYNDDNDTVNIVSPSQRDNEYQVYPIPFSNKLNISFEVKRPEHYTIKLFNMKGELVDVLYDRQLLKGRQKLSFELPTPHANQVFILKIHAGNDVMNKKIIQTSH